MQEVKTFEELPEKLTYTAISTALFERLRETGMPEEWQSVKLWDVYGEDGSVTGDILVRGEEIPEGCFYAVAKVFVVHEDGSVLLMRRHLEKPALGLAGNGISSLSFFAINRNTDFRAG